MDGSTKREYKKLWQQRNSLTADWQNPLVLRLPVLHIHIHDMPLHSADQRPFAESARPWQPRHPWWPSYLKCLDECERDTSCRQLWESSTRGISQKRWAYQSWRIHKSRPLYGTTYNVSQTLLLIWRHERQWMGHKELASLTCFSFIDFLFLFWCPGPQPNVKFSVRLKSLLLLSNSAQMVLFSLQKCFAKHAGYQQLLWLSAQGGCSGWDSAMQQICDALANIWIRAHKIKSCKYSPLTCSLAFIER